MLQLLADVSYNYSYNTTPTTTSSGLGAGFWIGYIIFVVIAYLITGFVLSKVFKKAGRSPGAAFVPIYNTWILMELGGKSGALALILLASWIPILGFIAALVFFVFYVMAMLELAKRFGKSQVFAIFGLVVFSLVGFIILAFDESTYQSTEVAHGYGPQPVTPGAQPTAYEAPQPPQPTPPAPGPSDQPPTGPVSG